MKWLEGAVVEELLEAAPLVVEWEEWVEDTVGAWELA